MISVASEAASRFPSQLHGDATPAQIQEGLPRTRTVAQTDHFQVGTGHRIEASDLQHAFQNMHGWAYSRKRNQDGYTVEWDVR